MQAILPTLKERTNEIDLSVGVWFRGSNQAGTYCCVETVRGVVMAAELGYIVLLSLVLTVLIELFIGG